MIYFNSFIKIELITMYREDLYNNILYQLFTNNIIIHASDCNYDFMMNVGNYD